MGQTVKCEYCGMQNRSERLKCECCGAPLPELVPASKKQSARRPPPADPALIQRITL